MIGWWRARRRRRQEREKLLRVALLAREQERELSDAFVRIARAVAEEASR